MIALSSRVPSGAELRWCRTETTRSDGHHQPRLTGALAPAMVLHRDGAERQGVDHPGLLPRPAAMVPHQKGAEQPGTGIRADQRVVSAAMVTHWDGAERRVLPAVYFLDVEDLRWRLTWGAARLHRGPDQHGRRHAAMVPHQRGAEGHPVTIH